MTNTALDSGQYTTVVPISSMSPRIEEAYHSLAIQGKHLNRISQPGYDIVFTNRKIP